MDDIKSIIYGVKPHIKFMLFSRKLRDVVLRETRLCRFAAKYFIDTDNLSKLSIIKTNNDDIMYACLHKKYEVMKLMLTMCMYDNLLVVIAKILRISVMRKNVNICEYLMKLILQLNTGIFPVPHRIFICIFRYEKLFLHCMTTIKQICERYENPNGRGQNFFSIEVLDESIKYSNMSAIKYFLQLGDGDIQTELISKEYQGSILELAIKKKYFRVLHHYFYKHYGIMFDCLSLDFNINNIEKIIYPIGNWEIFHHFRNSYLSYGKSIKMMKFLYAKYTKGVIKS
jgi:hypothetical protein